MLSLFKRNVVIDLFKWTFSTSGIQFTTAKPLQVVLFGKRLLYFSPLPGVEYRPKGPTVKDIANWLKWGKYLSERKCTVCGTKLWAWKKAKVCGKFRCFWKNGGKWN